MKTSRICALFLLVMVASALAFGDPIQDPQIIIHGAGGGQIVQGPCPQCVGVGTNFSFTVPEGGSGNLFFTNESGHNWNSLSLIETGVPAADISCHSSLFSSCTVKTLKNGSVDILLSNAGGRAQWKDRGIPNGANFEISFGCKGGCWPSGLTFNGHGSSALHATPEPGTIALMVTGLGALVSRRKRWRNRGNS